MRRYIHLVLALLAFATLMSLVIGLVRASNKSGRFVTVSRVPTSAVVVGAAGRGNPYINLSDGVELAAEYTGALEAQRLMADGRAESRALASADFDEDGVADLVCGYAHTGGGLITLHRGNVDSIFENSPEAQRRKAEGTFTDSAFLSPALVLEAPIPADFVGAGDFDADGHWDVVLAARGGKELCLMPGDGKGSLLASRRIALPGTLTSLATGEINRADGLTDVVAGVVAADGPKVLVFEGPEGALKVNPEIFSLPGEPNGLALGQFDDENPMDLAVGAGSELVIVHGRDRRLSLDDIRQADVLPAQLDRRAFGFEIRSIAAGDFTGSNETSLALLASDGAVHLTSADKKSAKKKERDTGDPAVFGQWAGASQLVCARVSTGPADDLVILNKDGHSLQIQKTGLAAISRSALSSSVRASRLLVLAGEPSAVLPMRLNGDALSDLVVLQGGGSAPAILKTTAPQTFTVNKSDDHDDGFCDSGDCTLREAINAANANAGADTIAFDISGAGAHTISPASSLPTVSDPVTIDGTTQPGFSGAPLIELTGAGLIVEGGNSAISGLVINQAIAAMRLLTTGGNIVAGNFIGTDISGSSAKLNFEGIRVEEGRDNLIGGTVAAARNVISGNEAHGVGMLAQSGSTSPPTGGKVMGNFIGTTADGGDAIGNGGYSVRISGAQSVTIGGTVAGAGNVISACSGYGVLVDGIASGSLIQGNLIGTDVTGMLDLGSDGYGVIVDGLFGGTFGNLIGGTTSPSRNVISGNGYGVFIGNSSNNQVLGNLIGTDVTGNQPLGNDFDGVAIYNGAGNLIGGPASGAGNTIAFNGNRGIVVISGLTNAFSRNSIHSNAALGIELGLDGVTPNDLCDTDGGPNQLTNFPSLTQALHIGQGVSLSGALNSTPSTTFTIEFFANTTCDPSGFGEGRMFIGSTTVTTATNCGATFNVTFPVSVPAGQFITATATDPAGNTSEFSQCAQVAQGSSFDLCVQDDSGRGLLKLNSSNGDYLFTNCNGVTLAGTGTLTRRGGIITLQHYAADRRVLATLDTGARRGTATIQLFSPRAMFTLTDRNLSNNTCNCPGST